MVVGRLFVDGWRDRCICFVCDNTAGMWFPPSCHVLKHVFFFKIFFPRSLIQELGYTVVSITKTPTTSMDMNRPPMGPHRRSASPKDQVIPIYRPPSVEPSTDSGHDASPEYELEDPPPSGTHSHSFGGNFHMQTWNGQDVEGESYVIDRHSRSRVRSRSEGHATTLHPYVRIFLVFVTRHFRSDRWFYCKGPGIPVTYR